MNRKELVRHVVDVMRANNIRKPIHSQKHVIHISDDDGNKKDIIIKKNDTGVLFTSDDVESVVDACMCVIKESLKRGEDISIRGFGTLGLHHRKARATKHPKTGESVDIDARYVPKFSFGNDLRMCAKIYELSINDKLCELPPVDDCEDGECDE